MLYGEGGGRMPRSGMPADQSGQRILDIYFTSRKNGDNFARVLLFSAL